MLAYGSAATRNIRYRKSMEDTHKSILDYIDPGDGYFAVFDGHAGNMCADWCSQRLHTVLEKNLKKYGNQYQKAAILAGTFDQVDRLLPQVSGFDNSGTTAAVAYIRNNPQTKTRTLYTANVGDSRIVLSSKGIAQRLSKDHRTDNELEVKRIKSCSGGKIIGGRVQGCLAITRALGDIEFKDYICGKPYTTETELDKNDEFFILACDGVWDVVNDQDAVDLVRYVGDPQDAAKLLARHALKRGSTDNITCLVVRLVRPANCGGGIATAVTTKSSNSQSVSTPTSPPHVISSAASSSSRTISHVPIAVATHASAPIRQLIKTSKISKRKTHGSYQNFHMPRESTPPNEDLLAQVDQSFELDEDPELEKHAYNINGIDCRELSGKKFRYGERRVSVPCVFNEHDENDDENSDAIAD